MLSLYEILKASKTGIAPDLWTALAGRNWNGTDTGHEVKELTGIPPLSFTADGQPLLDYLISGNMSHTGTPTSDNPIQPSECGERTGNLWNAEGFSARAITSTHEHTNTNSYGTTISSTIGKEVSVTQADYPTGNVGYQNGFFFLDVDFSKYSIGDVITLSFDYIVDDVHALSTQTSTTLYAGKNNNAITPILSSGDWKKSGRLIAVITIIADMSPYVEVRLCGNSITVKNIMLNLGSTTLPYEPYGYKLTISSANTTTPIYLGEVESTRRIKKLVLTGQESTWTASGEAANVYYVSLAGDEHKGTAITTVCTHFKSVRNATNYLHLNNGEMCLYSGTSSSVHTAGFKYPNSSLSDFKSYLAAQYAAGTPVCVWYVLANPETAAVNEPLRKIGDYADTLSMEQAGVQIPTNKGNTVIDVETELKPSQMYIKYRE